MRLLAGGISQIQSTIIAVLCVLIFLFVLTDIILVISLHRQNKKLAKRDELFAPDDEPDKN